MSATLRACRRRHGGGFSAAWQPETAGNARALCRGGMGASSLLTSDAQHTAPRAAPHPPAESPHAHCGGTCLRLPRTGGGVRRGRPRISDLVPVQKRTAGLLLAIPATDSDEAPWGLTLRSSPTALFASFSSLRPLLRLPTHNRSKMACAGHHETGQNKGSEFTRIV